ncbi:putative Gaf domaincontaining protein [Globisporangium polare]
MGPESVASAASAVERRRPRTSSGNQRASLTAATTGKRYSLTAGSSGYEDANDSDDEELVTHPRNVRLSDNHLLLLALEAAQAIDWLALSKPPSSSWSPTTATTTATAKPTLRRGLSTDSKPSPQPPRTSVFTREDNNMAFAAMAHTVIPCPLGELARMLEANSNDQYNDVMKAIYGDALVSAELVHEVETDKSLSSNTSSSGLLVKAVLLDKSRRHTSSSSSKGRSAASKFFSSRRQKGSEEWCYLDFVQRISPKVVRKTLFTLHPSQLIVGKEHEDNNETSGKFQSQGTRAGYLFEELEDGKSTRVSFWGEHAYTQKGGRLTRALANRTIKSRLLRLAESIDRFVLVVRRRRLGMQVMVDQIQVQASNSSCACCNRSFLLARKKVCNLCGYNVCEKCSKMEDCERRTPTDDGDARLSVSTVRICEKCIERVDQCNFLHTNLEDLAPPQIYADPSPTSSQGSRSPTTTGKLLGKVLQEALQNTPEDKVAPVLSIIKHLVDQERTRKSSPVSMSSTSASSTSSSSVLTDQSTEQQHFDTLVSRLRDPPLPLSECKLACTEQRTYLIDHSDDPTVSHPFPIPSSETRRLEIIRSSQLTSLQNVDELDIICSIVSKELECMGAMISISESDAFHVVATNIDFLTTRVFPRNEGFCSRTIMGVDPMLVPHPEADLRFSYILPVKQLSVSFYCGFPLFAEDFTVLGSLCCLGYESRKLTQSQFTVGKKLAETASRILQHHVRLRQIRTDL